MTKEMKNALLGVAYLAIIYLTICGMLLFMNGVTFAIYGTTLMPLILVPVAPLVVLMIRFY